MEKSLTVVAAYHLFQPHAAIVGENGKGLLERTVVLGDRVYRIRLRRFV